MWTSILTLSVLHCMVNADVYNTYRGKPATPEEIAEFQKKNIADVCMISFDKCNPTEPRRPYGSCNNLKNPSYGAYHTPQWRILPAELRENNQPRLMSNGEEFPLARYIRQHVLSVGDEVSEEFTALMPLFLEFYAGDIVSVHDIRNFRVVITHCCQPEGKNDPMCGPNYIPPRDFVHRFSNIKCLNNTRPITFQTTGCAPNNTVLNRINYVTTHNDLSQTYVFRGVPLNESRAYNGGRLKVEVHNGYGYPSTDGENSTCTMEQASKTGCTRKVPNGLLGSNLFTIWFWRHHNYIADGLAELNPGWSDEKLFSVAMDINIAYYTHILYYECFALVLGKQHLIRDGIILPKAGFRKIYNEKIKPQLAIEFAYALRWFHITQRGPQRMYDEHGNYVRTDATVDFSARVFDLPFNNTMTLVTHGSYMEASGGFDDVVDADIAETGQGPLQVAFDIPTADLAKGRFYGLPPYIKYLDLCSDQKKSHKTYNDLRYIMKDSKIDLLQQIYKNVSDVELMTGMYTENLMKDSWVPLSTYCLLSKQLKRSVVSDRFWFENPDRPNPLTADQMKQITSGSLAGLLCAIGDKVTEIQPHAFRRIGPNNPKTSCSKIPKLDLTPWKDDSC